MAEQLLPIIHRFNKADQNLILRINFSGKFLIEEARRIIELYEENFGYGYQK